MQVPLSTKVLLALGALGATFYVIKRIQDSRYQPPKPKITIKRRDPSCLTAVFGEGGQKVGDYERIWNDLHPSLRSTDVKEQVVDLEPGYAAMAYEYMLDLISNEGVNIQDDTIAREGAIVRTLEMVAGGCDWSEGLGPYTYGSPFQRVWSGVGALGELAQANLRAKGGSRP